MHVGVYFLRKPPNTHLIEVRTEVVTVDRFGRKIKFKDAKAHQDGQEPSISRSFERT